MPHGVVASLQGLDMPTKEDLQQVYASDPLLTTSTSASTKGWMSFFSAFMSASCLGGAGRSKLKGGSPVDAFRQAISWQ